MSFIRLLCKSFYILKEIYIYTVLGELISKHNSINNNEFILNTEHLNSGIYLMVFSTEEGTSISKKIIKK